MTVCHQAHGQCKKNALPVKWAGGHGRDLIQVPFAALLLRSESQSGSSRPIWKYSNVQK